MKKYINRLCRIKNYISVSYGFSRQDGLHRLDSFNNKKKLGSLCVLQRDCFWQAKRDYDNINIIDLPNLIKAEAASISPFLSHVFWQITKINTNHASVTYFAVPIEYIEEINQKCRFIYPLTTSTLPPIDKIDINSAFAESTIGLSNEVEKANEINLFNLVGFHVTKPKDQKINQQYLPFKKLGMLCSASVLLFILLSSAYLVLSLDYYEDKVVENKDAVERALKTQRELKAKYKSKQDFDTFSKDNRNVLAILSHLSFKNEKYSIQRIYLHPKGVEITGVSESSATNLLTLLVEHPAVSEAKFSRAVSKNRSGEDVFVIEVIFS